MEVDELRWFVSLAESEHVTDSAAECGISQPTLSRALARLEHRVGTPLFERQGRRLRLNAYGALLHEHYRRALDEVTAGEQRIGDLVDPARGTVRLAFLHSFGSWLVPELVRRFLAEAPQAGFALRQEAADTILAELFAGTVDLVITSPRPAAARVTWRGLLTERLCLAVPAGHRLARRGSLHLEEAAGERFVGMRAEFGLRQITDRLCETAGFTPDIQFETAELATIRGLVNAGLGVALVPQPMYAHPEDPVYLQLADPHASRTVGVGWVADRPQPPLTARFLRLTLEFVPTLVRSPPARPAAGEPARPTEPDGPAG